MYILLRRSLIGSLLKICERLFLSRFRDVLFRRSRLLANSAPVCTVFVDFRSAFDMLWHAGYLGISNAYLNWIGAWLDEHRGFIEFDSCRSRWL